MKAHVEDEEPPAWALALLKFSEDLVLESSLLEGGQEFVSANGRAAISTDDITCVPILDSIDERLPEDMYKDMKLAEEKLISTQSPPNVERNQPLEASPNRRAKKRRVEVHEKSFASHTATEPAITSSKQTTPSRPESLGVPPTLHNPVTVSPTIPTTDIYLKREWKRQWNLRSTAVHYPPRVQSRKQGKQILYFCQTCPRIHDNLAFNLALYLSKTLHLPLQVLAFLPRIVADAKSSSKSSDKQWRGHVFRRQAFSKFNTALAALKIPLVGLVVEDDQIVDALMQWEAFAEPHFIVTDDTHNMFHENIFKLKIQERGRGGGGNGNGMKCALFSMDSNCIYPPRLIKQVPPPRRAGAPSPDPGQADAMTFGEYRQSLLNAMHNNPNCRLFDPDWCTNRLFKSSLPGVEVQMPLYLVWDERVHGEAKPYVHDEIASQYDVIHWTSAMDVLVSAAGPKYLDGSEEMGLEYASILVRDLMSSGITNGLAALKFQDSTSALENMTAYVRMGSLSSRMVLRAFMNPKCLADALLDSRGRISDRVHHAHPVRPFPANVGDLIRHHLVERLEYRLYRVRYAFLKIPYVFESGMTQNKHAWVSIVSNQVRDNLLAHADDKVKHEYFPGDFEKGNTHDTFWNGCQQRLKRLGALHPAYQDHWSFRMLECRHSTAELSFDLALQLLRKYLFGGHCTDEVIAMVAELYHMNKTHVQLNGLNDLPVVGIVQSSRIDQVKKDLGISSFQQIIATGLKKKKKKQKDVA